MIQSDVKLQLNLSNGDRMGNIEPQSDEIYRLLVESVSDYAIVLLNLEGFVETWNVGAERLKSYTPDEAIGRHVCAGPVMHADDTTVQVLAPGLGRTKTGRLWAAVRDERPFAGTAPPAAFYRYSPDRRGEHAEALLGSCRGFLHADGYAGFNSLFALDPKTGTARLTEVACWAHVRRKLYDVHEATASPLAK